MAERQMAPNTVATSHPPAKDSARLALALFDLDRTLLPGSSVVALGRALVDEGLVRRRRLVGAAVLDARYRRRGATDSDVDRVRGRALEAVAGIDRATMREVINRVGATLAASVSPGARMLLDHHLTAGDFCVLLSASPQELVEVISNALGAHRAVGTRAEIADDRLTGELDGPFCYGPGKLVRLRDALGPVDLAHAWAYADSASDLPLLEACGNPVAVNPDRALRKTAQAHGWPIVTLG